MADFNSPPGSDSTLHSGATESNTHVWERGPAESSMQAPESHLFDPLQDAPDMKRSSVGAKSPHYPVSYTGRCRNSMKAKARGRMLLQKVILIDKAPSGPAVDC